MFTENPHLHIAFGYQIFVKGNSSQLIVKHLYIPLLFALLASPALAEDFKNVEDVRAYDNEQ